MPGETDDSIFRWLKLKFPESDLKIQKVERIEQLSIQLADYFGRRLRKFDVAVEFYGSEFQKQVWTELLKIPYGQVISYGELARRLNKPGGFRAVGNANGANPLPIVVPCHRVVGQNGKLVGYGDGLETKALLLRLESGQETLHSTKATIGKTNPADPQIPWRTGIGNSLENLLLSGPSSHGERLPTIPSQL